MTRFADAVLFIPTLGGTTDWVVSSSVTGYMSPAAAGMVSGATYRYRAESADLSQWEIGFGVYNSGTSTIARTTVTYNSAGTGTQPGQSGAGSKINFSTVPSISVVLGSADIAAFASATITKQVFTASGTWTPSPGMLFAIIEAIGGGGGGGGSIVSAAVGQYTGGGGGAGGYSKTVVTATAVGASQVVTIGVAGAGGAAGANNGTVGGVTSVGALCVANPGNFGQFSSVGQFGLGGAGAAVGTGDIAAGGGGAGTGVYSTVSPAVSAFLPSGAGGSSVFGGGGKAVLNGGGGGGSTNGTAGIGYGAGGSGGASQQQSTGTTSASGGNGTAGVVMITEFCGPV